MAVDQTATISCPAFPDLSMTGRVTGIASIASGDGAQMSYDGMGGSPTFAVDIMIDVPDPRPVVGKPVDAPANPNSDMPESPLSDSDVLVIAGGAMPEDEMMDGGTSGGGMEVR